ncbi:short-chain dehydrogenase/reductase SDR [Caldicellulosiruptor hydrothermalis 108]|uniref:Short-chain dehydrogenase/reductase SDR n=1 Tax=Caldicellulosiruptor hydrothermalis (strain DSM 18901 / VKM B-2411 / 108) TaxID=632292 RepID=E4QCF1_CALH1|nr:SDR family oxidoreductase [Caldicellulosiruptor hydrothermalis]ADQ06247.1 short-chain dehydrogenase/reductase SDR [Caldicellulosiruptor hydrothermalis 108]
MDIEKELKDKVVVITGGGGILCSEMAKAFAKYKSKVAVLDLYKEKTEKVVEEIKNNGGQAIGIGANVLDKESLEKAKEIILDTFGTVDILINGAGGNHESATTSSEKTFFDLNIDDISKVFNLNFLGTVLPSQIFGKIMAEKKKGIIINISSMAAIRPLTRTIAYSAAKAAVSNFTQWLAVYMNQEYSPHIRVNAIAPGFIITDQNRYLLIDKETGDLTQRGRNVINATPMGRFGMPSDLIGIVLFLCSESASFINGAIIPVDGAFSAYSGV